LISDWIALVIREDKPGLTPEPLAYCKGAPVRRVKAFDVTMFRALVEHIAQLAHANSDLHLCPHLRE
jgi:hypothetical protein